VVVNDFTVAGASTSATNSKKMGHVRRTATEKGMPFVHVGESTGARLPDAMGSRGMGTLLGNDPTQFRRSRDTPWAAAALDTSFGSSAWLCCCSDFAVMKKGSIMAVSKPAPCVDGDRRAGRPRGTRRLAHPRRAHRPNRSLHRQRRRDHAGDPPIPVLHAVAQRRATAGARAGRRRGADQEEVLRILPEKRTQVYDMRKIIAVIADRDSVFELKPRFGRAAITALARLGGRTVGIIANNPYVGAGALSIEAVKKIIDFQVLCDSFNVPLLRLLDTPGFVVGKDAEKKGAPGWIMNMMNCTSFVTVPSITLIVRKAYGRAYVAMGGGRHNDEMIAWPSAEVSFMDPNFATTIVHGVKPATRGYEAALAEIQKNDEVWDMAAIYSLQNIIKPQETRDYLIRMFDVYRSRRRGGVGQHLLSNWPTSY
jgi:acetyl-CoA carboxylase carboxyltransferase component